MSKRYIKDIELDLKKYAKLVVNTVNYNKLLEYYRYLSKLIKEFDKRSKRWLPTNIENIQVKTQKRLLNIMFGCGIKTTYEEFFNTFIYDKVLRPEIYFGVIININNLVQDKQLPCAIRCKLKVLGEDNVFYSELKNNTKQIEYAESDFYDNLNSLIVLQKYKKEHLNTNIKYTVIEQFIEYYKTLVKVGYNKNYTLVDVNKYMKDI